MGIWTTLEVELGIVYLVRGIIKQAIHIYFDHVLSAPVGVKITLTELVVLFGGISHIIVVVTP